MISSQQSVRSRALSGACNAISTSGAFFIGAALIKHLLPSLIAGVIVSWFLLVASVLADASSKYTSETPITLEDAVHLLHRTGIGAAAHEIDPLIGMSRIDAVNRIVHGLSSAPTHPYPAWIEAEAPAYWARGDMNEQQGRMFDNSRDRELQQLKRWWVREMIETTSPQTERLVLMWHSHFATAYSAINRESTSIARQHQLLRRLSSANFRDLLLSIVRDPAMLSYLDNRSNKKQSPNENLARELLELFTLGDGNFNEVEVREAARSLTGYTVAEARNMSFKFESWVHDDGPKVLFGQEGLHDGDDLVDLILQQPEAAEHIARLFWKTFISETTVDESDVMQLAMDFRNANYDIKHLYRQTLLSSAFWKPEHRGTIVKSPIDLLIGSIRSLGYLPSAWDTLPAWLARFGQDLFEPPNVAGWPGGAYWIAPDRLYNRSIGLHEALTTNALPSMPDQPSMMSVETSGLKMDGLRGDATPLGVESQSSNSMRTSNDNGSFNQTITVRLAGESYRGSPEFELILKHRDEIVWRSNPLQLNQSHDSERYGRVRQLALPWQILRLGQLDDHRPVDSVELRYINDSAGATGDRNLFVDWIRVGSSIYYAELGHQRSACPPTNAGYAGRLYCQGSVTIDQSSAKLVSSIRNEYADPNKDSSKSQNSFIVDQVYTWWIDDAEKPFSQFVIGLKDLTLGDISLDTLVVYLVDSDGLGLGLRIEHAGCWPDCFIQWPECSWQDALSVHELSVFFPTRAPAKPDQSCHFSSLAAQDQRLVRALWSNLPVIVDSVAEGRRAQREPDKFQQWQTTVNRMLKELDRDYYGLAQHPVQLHVDGSPSQPVIDELSSWPPLIAGAAQGEWKNAFDRLLKTVRIQTSVEPSLSAILSPIGLLGQSSTGAKQPESIFNVEEVLNNPSYQVR